MFNVTTNNSKKNHFRLFRALINALGSHCVSQLISSHFIFIVFSIRCLYEVFHFPIAVVVDLFSYFICHFSLFFIFMFLLCFIYFYHRLFSPFSCLDVLTSSYSLSRRCTNFCCCCHFFFSQLISYYSCISFCAFFASVVAQ